MTCRLFVCFGAGAVLCSCHAGFLAWSKTCMRTHFDMDIRPLLGCPFSAVQLVLVSWTRYVQQGRLHGQSLISDPCSGAEVRWTGMSVWHPERKVIISIRADRGLRTRLSVECLWPNLRGYRSAMPCLNNFATPPHCEIEEKQCPIEDVAVSVVTITISGQLCPTQGTAVSRKYSLVLDIIF